MRKELPGYPVYRLKMGLPRRYAPRNDGGMDSCFRRNDIKEKGEEIGEIIPIYFLSRERRDREYFSTPTPLSPRRERVRVRGICTRISNWSIGKSVNR